jgi:predicted DNA-binding transcriptional regulator AlpA
MVCALRSAFLFRRCPAETAPASQIERGTPKGAPAVRPPGGDYPLRQFCRRLFPGRFLDSARARRALKRTPTPDNSKLEMADCVSHTVRPEALGMTTRKSDIALPPRLTAYVTREEGAAELRISPSTWDELVERGDLPKPIRLGRMGTILRWRWADVDSRLRGDDADPPDEPYFRGVGNGTAKDRKRDAA